MNAYDQIIAGKVMASAFRDELEKIADAKSSLLHSVIGAPGSAARSAAGRHLATMAATGGAGAVIGGASELGKEDGSVLKGMGRGALLGGAVGLPISLARGALKKPISKGLSKLD